MGKGYGRERRHRDEDKERRSVPFKHSWTACSQCLGPFSPILTRLRQEDCELLQRA